MGKHTISGKFTVTEAELKAINSKITSAIVNTNEVVINAELTLTGKHDELDDIMDFLVSRKYDERADYAKLSTADQKIAFMEKRLGLK